MLSAHQKETACSATASCAVGNPTEPKVQGLLVILSYFCVFYLEIMEKEDKDKKKPAPKKSVVKWKWCIKILLITFVLSFCFSILSELILSSTKSLLTTIISVVILILFIAIAIICDMIGVAVASADIAPFMAMASKKVKGAKETIKLLQNADKASSFFCDIIGDACGIICGTIGASIIAIISLNGQVWQIVLGAVMSAVIAAITVFGKAIGKAIAIQHSENIVFRVGKFISIFKKDK